MKVKVYKYNNKIFCDKDISEHYENYGGDLWDLWFEVKKDSTYYSEDTFYRADENYYEDYIDLIENEFDAEVIDEKELKQ